MIVEGFFNLLKRTRNSVELRKISLLFMIVNMNLNAFWAKREQAVLILTEVCDVVLWVIATWNNAISHLSIKSET